MGSGINLVKILTNLAISPALLVTLVIPLQASACGFFDIKSCFSGGNKVEAQGVSTQNSQNLALLQATPGIRTTGTSTPDAIIVDDVYISPENYQINGQGENRTIDDDQISIYVVREGDTLPAIAKMFDVSVNTIRWGNNIVGNTIKPGQTLVILPVTGIQHTVKSGETIQSIAKLHKGDVDEIMQYNNLTSSSKLKIGHIIIVPDGEVVTVATTKPTISGSYSGPSYNGYYMRPIIGGVKTQGIHGHNGVDLASSYGSSILAAADGEVIIARTGWNGGYGTYVVIKHGNGTQTLYGHMSALSVSPGDSVVQGQIIGKMGSTGKSTGVHVHFEVRGAKNPF